MQDLLEIFVTERTENHARIVLGVRDSSNLAQILGIVRGPFCDYSKTLTADFAFQPVASGLVEALIVEPCYWTPQLPFWYDMRLKLKDYDGHVHEAVFKIGMKRFSCEGCNLRLESKRIVLRGLRLHSPTESDLHLARECETAIFVGEPTDEVCRMASRLGVPLIADLRQGSAQNASRRYVWYPAVFMTVASPEQVANETSPMSGERTFGAVARGADDSKPLICCDAYVVDLTREGRPPVWLATCNKPVIAIRKGTEAEIRTARANCDRLQAELAPEFDLAGYFV